MSDSSSEDTARPGWERSDTISLAAALVSVGALAASVGYGYATYEMQKSQNSISIINGFSSRDIVDAGIAVVRWSRKLPTSEDELIAFRRETSPMGRHLQTLAACLTSGVCDRAMMLNVFCSRARDYDEVVKNAFASAGLPKGEDDDFYRSAHALCAAGRSPSRR